MDFQMDMIDEDLDIMLRTGGDWNETRSPSFEFDIDSIDWWVFGWNLIIASLKLWIGFALDEKLRSLLSVLDRIQSILNVNNPKMKNSSMWQSNFILFFVKREGKNLPIWVYT